ncbi:MFS general substrate transporter [Glarea lozoyensis ATCC 20868]|uniref:MFS general substrate transporter n=1 Tax=Glarea lozoyensis (strain ATCC 20868 / MF5171) TaxID=1116229 RepID=S3CT59_GLAL2|nr:MFS general substrate transporter [Glarea lozoyensis ATCC 20868]EPE28815.1 MFS general substrate transporter [Glarea lozoyensis ATCC 20868]
MATSKPPIFLKFRSSTGFVLTTVALALFTDLWLYGIVVPILPFILSDRLNVPHDQIQSYTSILLGTYAGATVLLSPIAGVIADRLPARQIPFTGGLLALVASTTLLCFGQTIGVLILARILQGASAAVVWTVGMALVKDTVGGENLGTAIGSMFSVVSVGELLAPVLGGIVYGKAGNNAVFGMGFGLLGLDILMRFAMVEKKVAKRYGREYAEDSGTDEESASNDEQSDENTRLLAKPSDEEEENLRNYVLPPKLPRWAPNGFIYILLTSPRLLTAQLVSIAQATVIALFDATIPLLVQDLFNFTPLSAGLIFIPLVLPCLIFGPLAGKGVDRYGVKIFGTLGFLYLAIPIFLLRTVRAGGTPEVVKLAALLAVCAPGISSVSTPSIVEASEVFGKYHAANPELFGPEGPYAKMFAVNSMMFSAGLAIGPAMAGLLKERMGYGGLNAVVAGMCVAVAGVCFGYLGGRPRKLTGWWR